jgi:hypothetical protein
MSVRTRIVQPKKAEETPCAQPQDCINEVMKTSKSQRRKAQRQKKERENRVGIELEEAARERERANTPRGVFYPELALGVEALTRAKQLELQRFLSAVVKKRGHPLHLANLWNALYFGYDLNYGGFHAEQIESKRIPTRKAQSRAPALPVGGFVRVHTTLKCGDLLAEVVYKEGAHPTAPDDGDWVEPAISGAPVIGSADVDRLSAVVRERFVLDLAAFGPDGNSITPKQYRRLCDNARWLDPHGHLMMEAVYDPEDSALEDLDYYASYLLNEHREGLLAFCFQGEPSDLDVREGLLRSLSAVRDLAMQSDDLLSWRETYFFSAADYRQLIKDADGALGLGDLQSIANGLRHVPARSNWCYSPIRGRILEVLERDGLSEEEKAWIQGPKYAAAICFVNSYVADALEKAPEGPESVTHLRLDDAWQCGGIWRAERVNDPAAYSLRSVPPLIPLGLGYLDSLDGAVEEPLEVGVDSIAFASQKGFRFVLSARDRTLGRVRLPSSVAALLVPGPVDVAIRQEGGTKQPVRREGNCLYGVAYPLFTCPGIVMYGNVENNGGVVRLRCQEATAPVTASDGTILPYETDIDVYERALGLASMPRLDTRGVPSLSELINRAFRAAGRKRVDGGLALTLSDLAAVILGPAWRPGETRPLAVALAAMGLERDGAAYVWYPRITNRTKVFDRSLMEAYGQTNEGSAAQSKVRRHWVPMFLRRYSETSGRAPSHDKHASYAEARMQFKMYGVLPEKLPPGCTWVKPHSRGSGAEAAQLDIDLDEAEGAAFKQPGPQGQSSPSYTPSHSEP